MSSLNMARAIVAGHICSDVKFGTTTEGVHVCDFRVAVNRKGKDGKSSADFHNIQAWRGEADFVSKYFKKGDAVFVYGDIVNRVYEKDGVKRTAVTIRADRICFVDSKDASAVAAAAPYPVSAYGASSSELEPIGDDEELPF